MQDNIRRLHLRGRHFLGGSTMEDSSAETDLFTDSSSTRARLSEKISSGIMFTEEHI